MCTCLCIHKNKIFLQINKIFVKSDYSIVMACPFSGPFSTNSCTKWKLELLVFEYRGNCSVKRKPLYSKEYNPKNILNWHVVMLHVGWECRPHFWEACALTTMQPCSAKELIVVYTSRKFFKTYYLFCLFVFYLFADYRKFTRAYWKDCVSQVWQAYQQQL